MERELPHDQQAEQALLGAMLIDKDACSEVINIAIPDDFFYDSHKIIFAAMKALQEERQPVDVTTLTTYLMDKKELDRIGGVNYLLTLSQSVPTTAHTQYYLKILNDKALLRRLIKESTDIITKSYDDIGNMNDFINDVERDFLAVTRDRNAGEFKNIDEVVDNVTKRLNILQKNGGIVSGVKTGYRDLDKLTSGFQKGDLVILAARPSVGKTAFALNVANNSSYNSKEAVAVFSLEMPAEQLVTRLICCAGSINNDSLKTGSILKENPNKYYAAADKVMHDNLYIDDTPGIKVGEIAAKCRRLKQDVGLKLVIIDYLQLISGPNNSKESRQQEVSDISRSLKAMARELECPVIALSQLSRAVEQRKGKPMLSDLRESGAIEQDADIVAFLHREDYQNKEKEAETNGLTEIVVAKHRNGATADIPVVFEKQYSRFSDYTTEQVPEASDGVRDLRL
ncbi:replicative DNA helicase [Sharpea azabuensis]|uniref:Replicative DNA helicase n=2 Tax=Sharpea azabuensis TaxID=322505 RepID=A0A1H6VBV4_9FIRM|nr:replicative DNA helicase [Sharpea azabuensis]HCJ15268.1 replicative DNA helicase [Erysipelotrichaceae bacterium]MDD6513066.1 replicative DNA helicase [Sharpea azabuensis]MEE3307930.1 replicative DNA helicase [Sharpea azabuensis]SEJ02051.1 replicative DNA helicase [Sharpea azabuensis]SFE10860.1 replicative DNA helicase [Sharpea azabuensis]